MTRTLLAHSFFLRNDTKQTEKMRPYPPLGTLYAASNLRGAGVDVRLFDATFADGLGAFIEVLDAYQPAFLVLYEDQFHFLNKMCLNHAREAARQMAALGRARGVTVIAAGSDVTDHPEAYFEKGVQYALTGEADHQLRLLIDTLEGRMPGTLDEIAGLAMPSPEFPGLMKRNRPVIPERNPDVFPFPAWDLIEVEKYRRSWKAVHGFFSMNMVSTRGCPFHCNWCAKPIWGQRYAMRSPANVAEEMAMIKRTIQPDHIWFADDIFGLQPKWVAEFGREVVARNASVPFMIQSRVDLMTEVAVAGLAQAGCVEVWMGVESGSQKILDAMDKGTKLEQLPIARERLRQAGIRACFFLQFGYPGETFDDICLTIELVRRQLPDDIGISVSYPLPGTRFYEMVKAQLGESNHWQESNDLSIMFFGAYQSGFYRHLHRLLHKDLLLRQKLYANAEAGSGTAQELDALELEWAEWRASEPHYRNPAAMRIRKDYAILESPDLSQRWS